jgi:hypothetical protein
MANEQKTEQVKKIKKESAPKVRNAGHFLFVKDDSLSGTYIEVASYPDHKAFEEGVREKIKAIPEGEALPNWVHFAGRFSPVKVDKQTKVKITF